MTRSIYLLLAVLLLFLTAPFLSVAQFCGSSAHWEYQVQQNPGLAREMRDQNLRIKAATEAMSAHKTTDDTAHYIVPVVYHVLHDSGPELLSATAIAQDLANVNAAFANVGYYDPTTGAPIDISFCLAQRGKYGEPHDGIDFIRDTRFLRIAEFDDAVQLRRTYNWPSDKVLNIFTVRDISFAEAFASFPSLDPTNPQDGVVIKANLVGVGEAESAVMAHEIGHWLGLYHTFQNGCPNADCLMAGDLVCDTPPDTDTTVFEGCSMPQNNCDTDADDRSPNNPFTSDVPDMHNNYMDYNFDACYNAFTKGQRTRMRLALRLFRSGILRSEYCQPPNFRDVAVYQVRRPAGISCANDSIYPRIRLQNLSPGVLTNVDIEYGIVGGDSFSYFWTGQIGAGGSARWIDLRPLKPQNEGSHTFFVQTRFPNRFPDQFSSNDHMTSNFQILGEARLPFVEGFEAGLPPDWTPMNGLGDVWEIARTGGCDPGDAENQALFLRNTFYEGPDLNSYLTPVIDLSTESEAILTFDRAYRRAGGLANIQTLRVKVMEACDTSMVTEMYIKSQNQITGPFLRDKNTTWVPESCNDWKTEEIDLSEFKGKKIIVIFETDIGRGSYERLYLDNVQITNTRVAALAQAGLMAEQLEVYPVPSGGRLWVEFPMLWEDPVKISLSDALGREVYRREFSADYGWFKESLDLRRLATGQYFLRLQIGEQVLMRRVAMVFGLQN